MKIKELFKDREIFVFNFMGRFKVQLFWGADIEGPQFAVSLLDFSMWKDWRDIYLFDLRIYLISFVVTIELSR